MPTSVERRRGAAGFTLLEVVVAVAIAALALVGLFESGSLGLYSTDTAAKSEEALERAQSHLAAIGRNAAMVEGDTTGDDGGGYRWRLRIAPLERRQGVAADGTTPQNVTLYAVSVAISWRSHGHEREVVLRTVRLGTAAAGG